MMGPLRPRTASVVSVTVFTAISVVIALSLLATVISLVYLFLRLRSHAQTTQGSTTVDRSSSFGNTTVPRHPPSHPIALQSYPQRAQTPSYPPHAPPPLPATATRPAARPADNSPFRTTSPNMDPIPPSASTGHISPVSPIRNTVPTAYSTNEATQRVASMLARLQAIPLASDATDLSTDASDAEREVANPDFWAMLAQRGIPARDHALLGSDDSTDAGSRAGAALSSYAARARGMEPRGSRIDTEINRGRFMDHCQGGRGRAVTMGREIGDEGPGRVLPLQVRKMRSV